MSSLFHENMAANYTNSKMNSVFVCVCMMVWLAYTPGVCIAQGDLNPFPGERQEVEKDETASQSSMEGSAPMLVPIGDTEADFLIEGGEENRSRGAQTFIDDIILNSRNNFGFSLAAYQGYSEDISKSVIDRSSGVTLATAQLFVNAGRNKSRFHMDFGSGYRRYANNQDDNRPDYHANLRYSYRISNRTFFRIINKYASSYNDSWAFLSMYSPIWQEPDFSQEVLYERQRIDRNVLNASLTRTIGRRAKVGILGGYNYYKYSQSNLGIVHTVEAGGHIDFQLTDWLDLTNSYTTYLNTVEEDYRDARIHRLQLGGLNFRLSRSWRFWASGGVEVSDYQNINRIAESANARISHTSMNTAFRMTYRRGFASSIGIQGLWHSDDVNVSLGHQFAPWFKGRLESSFYRSVNKIDSGLLNTFNGGGGLEFALSNHLQMTFTSFYQKQKSIRYNIEGLEIERITAYLGFQFVWPALRREYY